MTRFLRSSCLFIAVCLASLALAGPVKAVPALPSSFYGTVKVDGQNVPDGTTVRALIDGQVVAFGQTQTYQESSVYALDIPGDDAATDSKDGGRDQDVIRFEVAGVLADQTGSWASGSNVSLNLTVTSQASAGSSAAASPALAQSPPVDANSGPALDPAGPPAPTAPGSRAAARPDPTAALLPQSTVPSAHQPAPTRIPGLQAATPTGSLAAASGLKPAAPNSPDPNDKDRVPLPGDGSPGAGATSTRLRRVAEISMLPVLAFLAWIVMKRTNSHKRRRMN